MKVLSPGASVEGIVEWMKTLPLPQRCQIEAAIRQATSDFRATATQRAAFDVMNWDDLLSLDRDLITVGSHTMSHPILTTLRAHEIEWEVLESRRRLEERLQRAVDFFCYPNGSYDKRAYQAVKNTYRAAVTTESGVVSGREELDLHRLPRIPSAQSAALTAWRSAQARSMSEMTVLVLDGHSRAALETLQSLGRAGLQVDLAAEARDCLAIHSRYVARRSRQPLRSRAADFHAWLRAQDAKRNYALIVRGDRNIPAGAAAVE